MTKQPQEKTVNEKKKKEQIKHYIKEIKNEQDDSTKNCMFSRKVFFAKYSIYAMND